MLQWVLPLWFAMNLLDVAILSVVWRLIISLQRKVAVEFLFAYAGGTLVKKFCLICCHLSLVMVP